MRKIFIIIFAAALGLTARAQEVRHEYDERYPHNWFVGVGGGFNVSYDGQHYSSDWTGKGTGISLDIYVGKWLNRTFGFRVGYHGINTSFDDGKVDNDHGSHPFVYAHADAIFRPATWFVPYFHAGYINVSHRDSGRGISGSKSGLGCGMGMMFPLGRGQFRFIPGIRATMMNGDLTTYEDINTKSLRVKFSATLGVAYRFGGKRKPHVIREYVDRHIEVPVEVVRVDTVHIHTVDTVYIIQKMKEIEKNVNSKAMADVMFDLNSAHLRPDAYPILQEVVDFMKEEPEVNVSIEGHACNLGLDTVNQPLSERRAQAVYEYLRAHGISYKRMTSKGFGSTRPKVSNETEAGRKQNRRIEFVFSL